MEFLNKVANFAVARSDGRVDKERFVSYALRELSVALCKGNFQVQSSGCQMLTRGLRGSFWWGAHAPSNGDE